MQDQAISWQYVCTAFSSRYLSYEPCREPMSLFCRNLEGGHIEARLKSKTVLEVSKMKVSNRLSSNVLAGLVSAAVLVGSSFGVAHAEGGAERLIDLRTKSVESRKNSASQLGFSTGSDLKDYLVEDGSERLRELFRGASQLGFSADDNLGGYLAEDGSERLRGLLRDAERGVSPSVSTAS